MEKVIVEILVKFDGWNKDSIKIFKFSKFQIF